MGNKTMKKIVRLTESDLQNMIREAVDKVVEAKNQLKPKKDRHRKGYYSEYNKKHPERLNRGFTKGYNNGNVSDGVKPKSNGNIWYDQLGRPHSRDFFNPTLTDVLDYKCNSEWHDDDWCEDVD